MQLNNLGVFAERQNVPTNRAHWFKWVTSEDGSSEFLFDIFVFPNALRRVFLRWIWVKGHEAYTADP